MLNGTRCMIRIRHYLTVSMTLLLATGVNSCIMDPDPIPEMPYRPRKVEAPAPTPPEQPVETTTWEATPAASSFITPTAPLPAKNPAPQPQKKTEPIPPTQPASPTPQAIIPVPPPQPVPAATKPEPTVTPPIIKMPEQPASGVTPTPAAETPPPAASEVDLKQITNTGPIPTAARVEGDPTRVWNPLDPSKKIRIINPKTNQPYPSGKKLKVRGTNFQFYVP